MKKLLAITVVLALVTGAAFAQVSASVETHFTFVDVTFDDYPFSTTYGKIGGANLAASGANDEGTLGGGISLRGTDLWRSDVWIHKAFVWWKPIDMLRIFLGIDQDGLFDTADLAGWSFHKGANDYLFNHHWDFWRGIFPGNWDGFGMALSLYPFDGFNFNIVIPTGGINWPQATQSQIENARGFEELGKSLRFQGTFSIGDLGRLQFAYNLGDKDISPMTAFEKGGHYGRIGLSFILTSLDGIDLIVGGSVVPYDADKDNLLISPGFAVAYSGESFGVKARAGANLQGDAKKFINFNVMPYFNLGPGQLMIDLGMSMDLKDGVDEKMGWFATPVYRLPLSGGQFSIGLQFFSNIKMGGNIELVSTSDKQDVTFKIPMLLSFGF